MNFYHFPLNLKIFSWKNCFPKGSTYLCEKLTYNNEKLEYLLFFLGNMITFPYTQIPASQVWVPTLYLRNSGSYTIRYRPDPSDLAYIYPGGYVDIWITTFFTVGCELKLQKYIFYLRMIIVFK